MIRVQRNMFKADRKQGYKCTDSAMITPVPPIGVQSGRARISSGAARSAPHCFGANLSSRDKPVIFFFHFDKLTTRRMKVCKDKLIKSRGFRDG